MNHVLTRHEHEKDNLRAEIEELKQRNSRLLDQLREKSMLMAHVQTHNKSLEKQVRIFYCFNIFIFIRTDKSTFQVRHLGRTTASTLHAQWGVGQALAR